MLKIYPLFVAACVATVHPLVAQPAVVVTLNSVAGRVRAQNPELLAAGFRIREAAGRVKQSGLLANPEIETSFEHNAKSREGKLEVGFSQRFPVTDRLRMEKEISQSEVDAARAEVRDAGRKLAGQARRLIVQVLANRQRRELLNVQAGVSNEFAAFLSGVAEKGEGSRLDAGQAKLEAASLAMELRQLEAGEIALIGELKPLLGMRPAETLSVGGSLPDPVIPSAAADPAARPDYQVAEIQARAAATGVALERARRHEDIEAGIFASAERSEDAPEGYRNDAIIGLRLKLPLPLWNKNEGAIEETEARKNRMEAEMRALGRGIRLEAEAARTEMVGWQRMIDEIDSTLLPLAEEQGKLAEEIYRKGQGEIQTVLRSREKRLQLGAARIDALREFHLARIRHDNALGK